MALNWQRYDIGIQVNEAMFVGSPGWVAKPMWMRRGAGAGSDDERKLEITGEVIGICSSKSLIIFFNEAKFRICSSYNSKRLRLRIVNGHLIRNPTMRTSEHSSLLQHHPLFSPIAVD